MRKRRDAAAVILLAAAAVAIGEASIFRRPDLSRTAGFLFGDPGFSLLIAREVLHGARLYADVAYQYGCVPVYLYAAVAAMAGNTPLVFLHFLLACSTGTLLLFYALARRAAGPGVALLVTLAGALPVLLLPGSLLGGYVNSYYIPIERALMIGAAIAWRPPSRRSVGRALGLGACLGALQFVRFGPGVALAGVVVLVDVAVHVLQKGGARRWLAAETQTFAAFAALEAVRIAGAFTLLPSLVARDVVWPAYILESYSGAKAFPHWNGWALAIGQYANPVTSLVLGAVTLAAIAAARSRWDAEEDGSQLLLPLFFVAGIFGLFRSEHHFYQAAWTVTPAAVVALRRWPRLRGVVLAAWLPPLALVVSQPLRPQPASARTVAIAPHWTLTVPVGMDDTIRGVAGALRQSGSHRVVFYPYLAGFNVALDLPLVGRESTFMHGSIRPYEEAALARDFGEAEVLATCRAPQQWETSPGLFDQDAPQSLRDALEPRAAAVLWRDDQCRVVRLRRR